MQEHDSAGGARAGAHRKDTGHAVAGPPAFEIQGHRGARGLSPENTLEGFAIALGLCVQSVETDAVLTSDGVPVVCHDLIRYDVGTLRPGSALAARFPQQVPVPAARIPTLAQVCAVFAGTGVRLDIELKTSILSRTGLSTASRSMIEPESAFPA